MSKVRIWIDGTEIKSPAKDDFRITAYLVTDMIRNAAGDMNGQIINKKTKLFFAYKSIMGYELRTIFNILQGDTLFHTVQYIDDGITYTKVMYVGDMDKTLQRTGAGSGNSSTWVWKNVSFNLIER